MDPSGQYLFGILAGEKTGIWQVSLSDKKCVPLLPGVTTVGVNDGRSFLYAVASRGELTVVVSRGERAELRALPKPRSRSPSRFPYATRNGNAYDFFRDLSTMVYARLGGHADLYLLSQK